LKKTFTLLAFFLLIGICKSQFKNNPELIFGGNFCSSNFYSNRPVSNGFGFSTMLRYNVKLYKESLKIIPGFGYEFYAYQNYDLKSKIHRPYADFAFFSITLKYFFSQKFGIYFGPNLKIKLNSNNANFDIFNKCFDTGFDYNFNNKFRLGFNYNSVTTNSLYSSISNASLSDRKTITFYLAMPINFR